MKVKILNKAKLLRKAQFDLEQQILKNENQALEKIESHIDSGVPFFSFIQGPVFNRIKAVYT